MSWRDQLQPGSFRGVPFLTSAVDSQYGRRVVTHEYPKRDTPYTEDLGRKAHELTVDCYVVGSNYMLERDALIEAIEKKDPGVLIHPFLGVRSKKVRAVSARVHEGSGEEGMARLSITFVEAGINEEPSKTDDTIALVESSVQNVLGAALGDFVDVFNIDGFPQFVTDAAKNVFNEVSLVLKNMPSFNIDIDDLIKTPDILATKFQGFVSQINSVADLSIMTKFGDSLLSITETTPSRIMQSVNQISIINLIKHSALAEKARMVINNSLPDITLDNKKDAISFRDEIGDNIDLLQESSDDNTFDALSGLRRSVVDDINNRLARLPENIQTEIKQTVPALVAAWDLYGDAKKEYEIISRNKLIHAGFTPAGKTVEYLKYVTT